MRKVGLVMLLTAVMLAGGCKLIPWCGKKAEEQPAKSADKPAAAAPAAPAPAPAPAPTAPSK